MKSPDRLSAAFFILLAVVICLASLKLSGGSIANPGSMVFPLLLGLSLLVLSIVFFIQSGSSSQSNFSDLFPKGEGLKVTYLLGIFFLSIFIFEPLGFVVSIFVLIVLLLIGIGDKSIGRSILYGLIISLSTYLLFTRLLAVRLPKGMLWF